jgi:hypothetical protein
MLQFEFGTTDGNTTAFLFTICFAAVTSLTDDQILENLSLNRPEVIQSHKFAAEPGLGHANFLDTQRFVTLHAFAST